MNFHIKNKSKTIIKLLISLLLIFSLFAISPLYSFSNTFSLPVWNETGIIEVSNLSNNNSLLELKSASAILIEENTGEILFEKNSHEQLAPASITKIMTILLIMENIDNNTISLEHKVPCSENASNMGGSQIWLSTNETLTVHEMLKAICVVSANDCAVAMAEFISGSEEAFVIQMNEKAKELGMNDTCFKNCHGIDEEGHITSSYDISIMSRELLQKHPKIKEYTTIWTDSLRDGTSSLVNTNKLIRTYPGATGLKTGSTTSALYSLSASATKDNLSLIAVILRAPTTKDRFNEAKLLLDFGFNKYNFITLATKDDLVEETFVNKGIEKTVELKFENSAYYLIEKNKNTNIETNITINENIIAPIFKGDILGKVDFILENETISSVNLIANKDIPKKSFTNFLKDLTYSYINLCK